MGSHTSELHCLSREGEKRSPCLRTITTTARSANSVRSADTAPNTVSEKGFRRLRRRNAPHVRNQIFHNLWPLFKKYLTAHATKLKTLSTTVTKVSQHQPHSLLNSSIHNRTEPDMPNSTFNSAWHVSTIFSLFTLERAQFYTIKILTTSLNNNLT